MHKIYVLLFGLITLRITAQKINEDYSPAQYKQQTCNSSFVKHQLTGDISANTIKNFLRIQIPNLKDSRTALKLNYVNESPGGFHYSFHQTFNNVEIYKSEIKVNMDRKNTVRSVFDNSENTSNWRFNISLANSKSVIAINPKNGEPVLTEREIVDNHLETLYAGDEIIFQRDINSYTYLDSLVSGKIFLPDPITSAQTIYGCPFCDSNDADNSFLDTQLQTVNFNAYFDGANFLLKNNYVQISDFDSPNFSPATSNNGQFYYNRSQSGFEDVNAFYHINAMQQHIQSLGFGCADSLIDVDTHALGGSDNSFYSSNSSPKRIYFGIGGIDDAEDADVCVHEYGHHISETASPNSNNGSQREALDEALGDYLAGSYSRSISSYQENWIFNWDGHNEYWNGRVLNSSWVYPTDITNSIYHNAQIWSPVLFCINTAIGRNTADSLILQALYSYAQNISMLDAAHLLMDADTILTGGKYACPIYACLFQKGLQTPTAPANCNVGIVEDEISSLKFLSRPNSFTVSNSTNEKFSIQIINIAGQMLFSATENSNIFYYENSIFPAGIYLVQVNLHHQQKVFKWAKQP